MLCLQDTLTEAKLLAQFNHINIVRYYECLLEVRPVVSQCMPFVSDHIAVYVRAFCTCMRSTEALPRSLDLPRAAVLRRALHTPS